MIARAGPSPTSCDTIYLFIYIPKQLPPTSLSLSLPHHYFLRPLSRGHSGAIYLFLQVYSIFTHWATYTPGRLCVGKSFPCFLSPLFNTYSQPPTLEQTSRHPEIESEQYRRAAPPALMSTLRMGADLPCRVEAKWTSRRLTAMYVVVEVLDCAERRQLKRNAIDFPPPTPRAAAA